MAKLRYLPLPTALVILAWALWLDPNLTQIAAGVAIFLFGMMALENGFRAFTGGALERFLQWATSRLWKSLTFGVLATTLMQSSSLVTVITISFLSAGLIGLAQGIGILFGANLGTTTGAWLIAGVGVKVDIAAYAMPLLIFGVLLVFQRSTTLKGLGYILAGVGFLFLGIHYMKIGFEAFRDTIDLAAYAVPGLRGLLIFTALGIFATVVMQSSHATLVLTITALAAGQITYENALALSIGANVGTTITAIIGALGANIEGRRLAAAHLIFNLLTGVVALVFIHQFVMIVEALGDWLGIGADDFTLKLALFHTLFNLTGILLLLPFIGNLVTLLEQRLKPRPRTVSTPRFINEGLLQTPEAGLEAVRKELDHLFQNVFDIMALVLHIEPARLRRGQGLEQAQVPPERTRVIDVDDYYQRRVKPLHGAIVDFIAQIETHDSQTAQAFRLRAASQDLIEALKDIKHLQKNLVRFMVSTNPHLQREYLALRARLIRLLHELQRIAQGVEENPALSFDILRVETEEQDIVANGQLDRLIRERRINSGVATSLMNDSGYTYDIAKNLINMARVVFAPAEPIMREIDHDIHLDEQEIHDVVGQREQARTPPETARQTGETPR
ncbi:Na/Pi symporter [Thioalkalicoccus limnaeus]|uniref:Na/Pi symporter n=1 Tax=Thioalkalicoccus limnaeus TaxID=120681 RepID=A0ABV4BEG6_9GAMM